MLLRVACLLGILALLGALALFLRPSGRSAIVFSFVSNPLLALAVLLGLLWWWRNYRGRSDANVASDFAAGPGVDRDG
jgi:hypothetical protein